MVIGQEKIENSGEIKGDKLGLIVNNETKAKIRMVEVQT